MRSYIKSDKVFEIIKKFYLFYLHSTIVPHWNQEDLLIIDKV